MRAYMIRRLGHSIFIILGIMALLFFAINVLGDPVQLLVDEEATQEMIDSLREKYGFDRPLHVRLGEFYKNLAVLDFGKSIRHRIDAGGMVLDRIPNTFALGLVAWGLGSLGIPLGILAARRPRGIVDRVVNVMSFAIISIPDFWLALMLILLVSVQMGLLPTSGHDGLGPDGWKYIILPAIALCPRVLGRNAQITRATMIEELGKQYVSTARAKGLGENTVPLHPRFEKRLYRHRDPSGGRTRRFHERRHGGGGHIPVAGIGAAFDRGNQLPRPARGDRGGIHHCTYRHDNQPDS